MTPSRRYGRQMLRGALALAATAFADACTSPTSDATRSTSRTTIILAGDSRTASARPAGPFVSVLDSIDLVVTSSSNTIVAHNGQRLHGYDSTAALSVDLPSGTNTFAAQVLSNTGAVIFSGQASHTSAADRDTIVIPLAADQAALLVTPDTVRTNIVTSSQYTIYNAGTNTLAWNVSGTDTAFARCECLITPQSGQLGAGQSATMHVAVPTNFPSRLFSFVIHSGQGDVTARWQYGASPIGSVVVQPTPNLLTVGQALTLTATVQSGTASAAVTWSSSNNSVATVSSAGRVQAGAAGSATIAATSVIDTTRRGFADVRVYNPADAIASWLIVAPANAVSISRDGFRLSTVVVTAQAGVATGAPSPFALVEFWVRQANSTTWVRIPQTPVPTATDLLSSGGRIWTWSIAWDPSPSEVPIASGEVKMAILALGIRGNGQTVPTAINSNVIVSVP